MRCWEVGDSAGLDSLRLVERPDPAPPPGWVLVDVMAAALNWRDVEIVTGQFRAAQPYVKPPQRIPLSDGAGVVREVGAGVTRVAAGDRVVANHFSDWVAGPWSPADHYPSDLGDNRDGFATDTALLPAHCLVTLPDAIDSWTDACTLPTAGLTAWRMLFEMAGVKASDTILTLGTGGVSVFTVQLAKLHSARVIVTSSSDEKLALMRTLGADVTINYAREERWDEAVMEATDGVGADVVFDNAGPVTMRRSMRSAADNGKLFMVGRTAGEAERRPDIVGAYVKNLSIHTLSSGPRIMLDDLVRAWGRSGLRPLVGARFAFEDLRAAFDLLERGAHVGKVVLDVQR